ncbi:MAG: hypothetical protein M3O20_11710 [Acidobacteriota bacterium]|nr:hypothetical protein [Acidobacteriota bacterium]
MSLRESFVLLFIAGLAPGLIQLSHPTGLGLGPGREMAVLGKNLAHGGIYGDSFRSMKTGPTAMNPPLYPLFLASFFRLFRDPVAATIVILLANVIVNALIPAMLPRVSVFLWGTAAPGIAAGVLSILSARLIPDWDADYTQLGLILFCVMTMRVVMRHGLGIWQGAISGAALGILFLLSQVILLVALPWIGLVLMVRRARVRDAARFLITLTLAAAVVNVPWLVRNYRIWGEVTARTNFGMVVYSSNNDCAAPSLYEELASGCSMETNPESSVPEASLLKRMGEPAYARLKLREAKTWIQSHPRRFLQLTLARIVQFWFPVPVAPFYASYMVWGVTILSLPGIFLMCRRRVWATWFLGAVFLLYPLAYYIAVSEIRYRIPVLWLSCLAAGYFLAAIPQWRAARVLANG